MQRLDGRAAVLGGPDRLGGPEIADDAVLRRADDDRVGRELLADGVNGWVLTTVGRLSAGVEPGDDGGGCHVRCSVAGLVVALSGQDRRAAVAGEGGRRAGVGDHHHLRVGLAAGKRDDALCDEAVGGGISGETKDGVHTPVVYPFCPRCFDGALERRCRIFVRPVPLVAQRVSKWSDQPAHFRYHRGMPITLLDPDLLRQQAYIDGQWVDADSGDTFAVIDPATGAELARVPRMGTAETARAIAGAERAQVGWRAKTAKERGRILRDIADRMIAATDDLAAILTAEQGKPLAESRAEIAYAASFLEWFGEEAKRIDGAVIPAPSADRRIVVLKQPIGVTAGITPWNFPSAMPTRKAAPALAAGCTMVLKPAEQTPLSALAVMVLAERAGLPPGVWSVVTGDAADAPLIGGELTSNPIVRKLGFTGSTEVGKLLMAQCAKQVKKVSLELGGNAPFIVFDDADLDEAIAGAMLCKYRNSGQTCISANRILVQDGIHDAFVERLVAEASALSVAPGTATGAQIGPLIDAPALAKVVDHVDDAVARGGEVLVGGGLHALGGTFFAPTVIAGATMDWRMSCEETFGPVAAINRFTDEADAIRMANDTPYGLAAYIFTNANARIWRVSEALEYGMVGINTGFISTETAPFGGIKESGIGREGSRFGIDDWVELKYLAMGGIA